MIKRIFFTLSIILLITIFAFPYKAVQASTITEIIEGADKFIEDGKGGGTSISDTAINNASDLIYNTLLIIGTCIAVVFAAILGIQFITGSVEQKVKVQESLIPFIAGCVVIFGAFGIWKLAIMLLR